MPRPDESLVGRVIGGKFAIEAHIGSGAMGQVYRARQLALEKTVAVKVLHQDLAGDEMFAARFHREAMAASRLDHPNSMRVIDFGAEPDGMLYIAMEFLDGRDLHRILYEESPLPEARIVDILTQALGALVVAHDMGVIHRDLKPENIMILDGADDEGNRTDIVKVCDFGIAKISGQTLAGARADSPRGPLTTQGLVVGTPEYMSPEQGKGDPLDARSDLYSVGVILFQLLTAKLPFQAETALGLVFKQVNDAPPRPSSFRPGIHPLLESICLKALSKRPADRYQTAREMRATLRGFFGSEGMRSVSSPPTTQRSSDRALEHAITENVQVVSQPSSGALGPATTSQVAPLRTLTGTATLPALPVSQPNIWILGAAALLVGAGLTAFGAIQLAHPGPPPVVTAEAPSGPPAASAPAEVAAASTTTPASVTSSSPKATAPAASAAPPIARAAATAASPSAHANKLPPALAPMVATTDPPTTSAFSLTTSAAVPTVTRATGVAATDVRAALPSWTFTQCYRTALERAQKPLEGHVTLTLALDSSGAVTRVAVRGAGPLLSATGDCMMDAVSHVSVSKGAAAGATADVDVACTPR